MAANYPEGSNIWCPVCLTTVKNVDKHLKAVHHLTPGSEEQKILCALGRDRTRVDGELVRCPLFGATGCAAEVANPKHHLKHKHKDLTAERMTEVLRPLRYEKAMMILKDLRRSKRENMITHLDQNFDEGEPAPRHPGPSSSQDIQSLQAEVKALRRANGLMRQELSKLQEKKVQTFGTHVYREGYCNQLYHFV